jgi:hypothetical protein
MGVWEDFEAGAAAHQAAVSAGERRAAEAADALADALAARRKNAAEITSLLERFRRAAHGTANATAQAVRQNWRGKDTYKRIRGWGVSDHAESETDVWGQSFVTGFMYLLLDIDGGLWIVSQSLEPHAPRKEAMAYHWRLGQSTKADFSPRYDNSIGKWIDIGVARESSIPGHLGKLVDQLGITI